jgi:hypothetical protein
MSKYHNIFMTDIAPWTNTEYHQTSETEPLGLPKHFALCTRDSTNRADTEALFAEPEPLGLLKHLALCTRVSTNRADTEAPKSGMDAAMRDYNPSVTLPLKIDVSAGDNLNHLDPSSSNNHDSYYHASSHSSNYTRGYPVYDPYNTPSNGAVKYDDTAKVRLQ